MISLEVIQGPDQGRTFQLLESGETLLGRQSEHVPLSDGTVSRQHARLARRDGTWYVEDVGSVNGTFVNGVRIHHPTRLHLGDQVRCGRTLLVFGSGEGARPAVDVDENGRMVDAAIMATVPANDDSVIIPTPEAGAQAIDTLRILYHLSGELTSVFSLDQLTQRTLDMICDVLPADRAFILLLGGNGRLIPKASRDRTDSSGGKVPISRTIVDEVVRKEIGVLSSNAMRDKRFSSGKSVHDYGIRSAICVPIKGRQEVLGVIHVDSSVADFTYSTEQLRLLTAIGYQTGLAIENVRLYESAVKSERLAAAGQTLATLSHHIKNILQGLVGGTDAVEKALAAGNARKASDAWPIIRRSLDRINAVILNMLAFSRPRQVLLESVNVNHVLSECTELLAPQADEQSVALVSDLGDVPPVPADPVGLHQAFLNLLTNALEAVKPAEGIITLTSRFDGLERRVVVRVADNGVGIEPGKIESIFDLFYTTKTQKGTGLGLAVVKKVVHEHDGRIEVQSTPGKGTTFTVRLPTQVGLIPSSSDTQR